MATCNGIKYYLKKGYDIHDLMLEFEDIRKHIDECSKCKHELEGLDAVWKLIDAVPEIEVNSNFEQKFWERIKSDQRETGISGLMPRVFLKVAYVFGLWCLVVFISYFVSAKRSTAQVRYSAVTRFVQTEEENSLKAVYLGRSYRYR
ncbi:MAG: hypothetical protein ABII27_00815 [bacterium]